MSDPATTKASDPVEALRSEATARLAALDAKVAAPKAASESKAVDETPKDAAVKASVPDGANAPVEATKAVDVEWLPENLRSQVTLTPEAAAYLKAGHLRRGEASRLTKSIEEQQKQIEAIKAKAGLWERLEANPEVAAAAYKMLNGEAAPTATPDSEDEVPDPVIDPKGYAKWIRAQVTSDIEARAAKVVEDRVVAPRTEEAAVKSAALSWAEDNHVTDNAFLGEVAKKADSMAKRLGVKVTPESVSELLSLAYDAMGTKAPTNGRVNGTESGGLLKVVSPSNRGSTTVAPTGVPQHIRENRAPQTNEERMAHAAHLARERLGMKVSTEDIATMFNGRGFASR